MPQKNKVQIRFDQDGNLLKTKYCRCDYCAYCSDFYGCKEVIATYPGEDPDSPGEAISAGKFNALQYCSGCREARRSAAKASWMREHRSLKRTLHRNLRKQAQTATETAERMEEALQTADQVIANYRSEIHRLGGDPDGGKRESERGGVLGLIERIVKGGG